MWYDPDWMDAKLYRPEAEVDVLVLRPNGTRIVSHMRPSGEWHCGGVVTHWIELPDLPREGRDDKAE